MSKDTRVGKGREETPFEEAFKTLSRRFLCEELNTVFPATIESYDSKTQSASVKIAVTRVYKSGSELEYPVVVDVPVVQPRTATAMIHLPIKEGDGALVLFSKADLGEFLKNGVNAKVAPSKQFKLNDAIAIVGLFPFGDGLQPVDDTALEIVNSKSSITMSEDGTTVIANENTAIEMASDGEVTIGTDTIVVGVDGSVTLSGSGAKALVNDTFQSIFDSHTHLVPEFGTSDVPIVPMLPTNFTTKVTAV